MTEVTLDREARTLLRSSLEGRRGDLLALIFWSAVEAAPALLSGRLIAWAVDRGFLAHDVLAGLGFLALLAVVVVLGTLGTWQAFSRLAVVIEPFRDRLVRLSVTGALHAVQAGRRDSGAVARLTQHVEIVRESYASVLMVAQGFLVTSVGAMIGLSLLLPAAVPLVAVPLALSLLLFGWTVPRLARQQRRSIMADEDLATASEAVVGALRDISACGAEATADAAIGRSIEVQRRAAQRLARMTALRTVIVAVGGWLPVALILLDGNALTSGGASTGAVMGALTYVLQGFYPALHSLVNGLGSTGLWLLVTLRRIVESSRVSPAAEPTGPRPVPPREDGSVVVDGLTFAYSPHAEPVVQRLDLTLPPGSHVAIVGPSGAGKSTLAALISGMLTPQHGRVLLDGVPVLDLAPAQRARRRVLVPQEAYVFGGTVADNLRYLSPAAGEEEIARAIVALGAAPLIDRLGGLDAMVDGRLLAAGERQLLTLVRAYLSPAPLMILDEATCHLDPELEERVEDVFARRRGSLVVIAHRISSAARADSVLVLDGSAVEFGPPHELLVRSPTYRELAGHWDSRALAYR